ncbi:serine/threonine protein kinase [Streptomyces griseocarneus]|nr:serine/threonine protein kinase [Streptomyces griseocarneus]
MASVFSREPPAALHRLRMLRVTARTPTAGGTSGTVTPPGAEPGRRAGGTMRGTTVANRYRLMEAVGRGGMGEVWRAEDLQEGRQIALKIITLGEDSAVREAAFRRETGVARCLSHPHIVAVHDHGTADVDGRRALFLTMDLVDGRPLSTFTTGPLPIADTLTWAAQISQALHAAHQAGIVHRDIKPSNILIEHHQRTALLCDFGIARLADATGHTLTVTGAPIGTPTYMSPEQARGDKNVGAPSDLYSLGCLIHELLTGTAPFTGSGWHVLHQHLHDAPAPLSTLRPDVSHELEHLVLELLDKDPARRPTAAETLDQLRAQLRSALPMAAIEPHRPPSSPTLVDTPNAVARRRGPGPRVTALWAGAVTGAVTAGELTGTTTLPSPWPVTLGTLAGLLLSTLYLFDPPQPARPGELHITTAGLFTALLLAFGSAVGLLVIHPAMWWAALATAVLGGPVLVACSSVVRRTVQRMLHRPARYADLASSAGALHTATLLLAASRAGFSVPAMLAAGLVLWPFTALLTAMVTARGARNSHSEPHT